jgi:carboxypeptidase Taq
MSDVNQLYLQLEERMKRLADLNAAAALMQWDQETHIPKMSFEARAKHLSGLLSFAHDYFIDEKTRSLLDRLMEQTDILDEVKALSVKRLFKDYQRKTKLPASLIEQISLQTSQTYVIWEEEKKNQTAVRYFSALDELLKLKKEEAYLLNETGSIYTCMLEEYEPGMTEEKLNTLFDQLLPGLKLLYEKSLDSWKGDVAYWEGFAPDAQWNITLDIAALCGFNFEKGRQDVSSHPFTIGICPDDVRITTRINPNDLSVALWSTIHEAGHAIYEQGLQSKHHGMPLSEAASLGIHESQSRLWENNVGRSKAFWELVFQRIAKYKSAPQSEFNPRNCYVNSNKLHPGLIRTEADEISYHFHVFIRYSIEKQLISGELKASNLRDAWNALYFNWLGLEPAHDGEGVLQDVHWAHGSFGYFPTYTLGSIYASQFYETAVERIGLSKTGMNAESLLQLRMWLNENVFRYGRTLNSEEICRKATGQGINVDCFLKYISDKYVHLS